MVNGFGGNGGLGNFEIEPYYARQIDKITNGHDKTILALGGIHIELESRLSPQLSTDALFVEVRASNDEAKIAYKNLLALYKIDCQVTATHCRFASTLQEQIGLDGSTCQVNQLYAIVATTIDADDLANGIKIQLFILVVRNYNFNKQFIKILGQVKTWDLCPGETLESQLLREMSLIAPPHLSELFSTLLKDFATTLQERLLPYEGCEAFAHRKCILCGDSFEKTVIAPFPLPRFEEKPDPRLFYSAVFRRRFFQTIINFLKKIQID